MLMRSLTVDSQAVQRHRATILECVKVFYVMLQFPFYLYLIELPEYFVSTVFTDYGIHYIPQS